MLRIENLQQVYKDFSPEIVDLGSLKSTNFLNPTYNITTIFLRESERFWAATLLQILAARELQKVCLHTWGNVTLYYGQFFAMNAVLRLAGRAITFSEHHKQILRIVRPSPKSSGYDVKETRSSDHKGQWNLYYDLIQQDITDNRLLKDIFDFQLKFRHEEREFRQWLNYDLEYGFDEPHYDVSMLQRQAETLTSMFPFEDTVLALSDDTFYDVAAVISIWRELKTIFTDIAQITPFKHFWKVQTFKLNTFVSGANFGKDIKDWVSKELNQ